MNSIFALSMQKIEDLNIRSTLAEVTGEKHCFLFILFNEG